MILNSPRWAGSPAAILWDLDGTLIDSEPLWHAEQERFVRSAGGSWTHRDRVALVGMTMRESSQYLLTRAPNASLRQVDAVSDLIVTGVIERLGHEVPWRPGARELLGALSRHGVPMALVTSAWPAFVEATLRHLPAGLFQIIVDGNSVAQGKPHPDPYLRAHELLGVPAKHCLAIEDSAPGVRSAIAAGIATLAVPHVGPVEPTEMVIVRDSLEHLDLDDLTDIFAAARRH